MMKTENEKLRGLLREARTTFEMWKDVAPAISLCADIDATLSRCAEILEWQNTGVLPGDALRAFAARQSYAADRNHLQMAEADTARQAYRFVVRSGQVEPAPAQDERETTMQTEFGQINTFDFRTDEQRNAPLILTGDSNCDHLCDECEQMACECEAA